MPMSLHVRLKKLQLRSSIYCARTSGNNSVNETVLNTYYMPGSTLSPRGMKMNSTQSPLGREQAAKQILRIPSKKFYTRGLEGGGHGYLVEAG